MTFAVYHLADDYEYDLNVETCDGGSSPQVTAYFCPDIHCNTSDVVEQTLTEFADGVTTFPVSLEFNPISMKLWASDDEW